MMLYAESHPMNKHVLIIFLQGTLDEILILRLGLIAELIISAVQYKKSCIFEEAIPIQSRYCGTSQEYPVLDQKGLIVTQHASGQSLDIFDVN